MVLEWCISVADIAALVLLSKFHERTKANTKVSKETPNIDYVTGKKLPYIMVGDDDYIDSETGVKLTSMVENYDED